MLSAEGAGRTDEPGAAFQSPWAYPLTCFGPIYQPQNDDEHCARSAHRNYSNLHKRYRKC